MKALNNGSETSSKLSIDLVNNHTSTSTLDTLQAEKKSLASALLMLPLIVYSTCTLSQEGEFFSSRNTSLTSSQLLTESNPVDLVSDKLSNDLLVEDIDHEFLDCIVKLDLGVRKKIKVKSFNKVNTYNLKV